MRPAIICSIRARNGPSRVPKTVTGNKTEALDVEMVQMLAEERSHHIEYCTKLACDAARQRKGKNPSLPGRQERLPQGKTPTLKRKTTPGKNYKREETFSRLLPTCPVGLKWMVETLFPEQESTSRISQVVIIATIKLIQDTE